MAIHSFNEQYKRKVLDAPYEICIERARYFTESYRETVGEHPALRASKAFAHTVRNMSVYILDGEQIVGNRSSKLVGAFIAIERGEINAVLELELDFLSSREKNPYLISDADRHELLKKIIPYWKGKTLRDRKNELWKRNGIYIRPNPIGVARMRKGLNLKKLREGTAVPKFKPAYAIKGLNELLYNNPALVMNVFDVQGHLILGHKNILEKGFAGVAAHAQKNIELRRKAGDIEGVKFLEGVIISCDAIRELAGRFADCAEADAAAASDKSRARELKQIAKICRRVPWQKPRNFREAIQAVWLTEIGAFIAYGMTGIFAVGRIDQYLYPFYRKDIDEGRITEDEARRLIEELLIKLSYNLQLLPYLGKKTGNELGADSCAPTIGGLDKSGENAVNDLSYVVLDAFANIKSLGNSFTIRLAKNTPDKFWRKALETFRYTSGAALFNDDITIPALQGCGLSIESARDYGVIGCVEPTGDGDAFGCTSGNDISLTAGIEMTLLGGVLRIMGKQLGPKTGDPRAFTDFDQFFEAYKQHLIFMIDLVTRAVNLKDQAYMEKFPNPFVSATIAGCVEKARDMTAGGAIYNFGSVGGRGLGTAVDSLAAIKKFVYEDKSISMQQMIEMLDRNFDGDEKAQTRLLKKGPKYGRDDAFADRIAKEVVDFFCREVSSRKTIRGGPFRPSFFSYGMHVVEGLFLGATPDGRSAGDPVSNSFSPSNGAETGGPTAMLRSVAQVDHSLISNGCALNVKFSPALFEGEERLGKMVALVKTFFDDGGMEIQPNVVSNETLRRAQQNPAEYRDLAVRVSGYSALFTDLGTPLQDEIISRLEFGAL